MHPSTPSCGGQKEWGAISFSLHKKYINRMEPELQRTEIAKACGWKIPNPKHYKASVPVNRLWMHTPDWDGVKHSATSCPIKIPDYLNDLNACHEMEKVLEGKGTLYQGVLMNIMGDGDGTELSTIICHATAPQRCEAFLKTIGKWIEPTKLDKGK